MESRTLRSRKPPPSPTQPPPSPTQPPAVQVEQSPRARWTDSVIQVFADLLADQVKKGNMRKKSFAKAAWEQMTEDFYKSTGMRWDKEKLKSRYSTFRRLYCTVKTLLERDDFAFDESTGAIIATDDVWNSYIKAHPDAETLRSSGCPIYRQLCIIFSRSVADDNLIGPEDLATTAGGSNTAPCPDPVSVFQEDSSMDSEGAVVILGEMMEETEKSPSRKRGRKGRKGLEDHMADAILQMASASKLRAVAVQRYHEKYSIENCVKALDEIEGVDDEVYFAAVDMLNEKAVSREIFLSLKAEKRLMWLVGKCKVPRTETQL